MHPLVTALVEQQKSESLGNNAFARVLGLDKATWSNVRRGRQAPSGAVFSAALRVYPELVRRVATELEISNETDVSSLHSPVEVAS